jgi:hypothetical protein
MCYHQKVSALLASGITSASISTMIMTAEMTFLFLPELKNLNIIALLIF